MRTTATPTAKVTVALAPGYSCGNHSDNNDSIFGNNIKINSNNNNSSNANSYDSSGIGASLLPFLHSGPINNDCEKKNQCVGDPTTCDDAIPETGAGEFHNNNAEPERYINPEKAAARCGALDQHHDRNDGDRNKRHDCVSLLLDGRTSTASTDGCTGDDRGRQPQRRRDRRQKRTSRKRILLRGPPRSGKTSLSMNLAYAEAATKINCCGGLPCGCAAVIVYRPNVTRCGDNDHNHNNTNTNYDDDGDSDDEYCSGGDQFPLFCRALPAQIGEVSRVTTNAYKTNDRTKGGLEATALGNAELKVATKWDEDESWDPTILNRIRICRVSSVRDLWEDMLVLAGKPLHEQPSRAIIVEDLDQIIGLGGDLSNHSHNSGSSSSGNSKKHNYVVAMMLKTVAIATDTALAIEKSQNRYPSSSSSSRSNCVTLLVTLTMDSRQQQRDASMNTSNHNLRCAATNAKDLSDILVLASCIDTVVTLHQKQRGIDNMTLRSNNNDDDDHGELISCVWKKPMTAATRTTVQMTRSGNKDEDGNNKKIKKNESNFTNETILVNSVWQAEIQERGDDQYYGNIGDGINGDINIGASLVDYAFVESLLAGNDNRDTGECEGGKELRWKHRDANS